MTHDTRQAAEAQDKAARRYADQHGLALVPAGAMSQER